MFKKILIASDGSSPSIEAAKVAADLSKRYGASLTVVTVAFVPKVYGFDLGDNLSQVLKLDWKRVLDSTVKEIGFSGVKANAILIEGDEPSQALLSEIKKGGYDLVVMGRTGAGNPGSKILGGISRKISEAAPCSILLVH